MQELSFESVLEVLNSKVHKAGDKLFSVKNRIAKRNLAGIGNLAQVSCQSLAEESLRQAEEI